MRLVTILSFTLVAMGVTLEPMPCPVRIGYTHAFYGGIPATDSYTGQSLMVRRMAVEVCDD